MCVRERKLFCLSALLLLFSLSAFAQAGGSPLPVPDFSEFSEFSELSSQGEAQIELPKMPTPQIDPRMPLEKRQALMLKAWIAWSKEVETSWNKAKSSYEIADESRVKQIESRDIEIAALIEQLKQTRAAAFLSGIGGFAAGVITDRVITR